MKKIKVLHIIPDFGVGGAEKLALDLCTFYDNDKFEISALSLFNTRETIYDIELKARGIQVKYLDKKAGLDISMISKIFKFLRRTKPDIIHTHRYVVRYTLIPAILCRIPVKVHTIHNVAKQELDKVGIFLQFLAYKIFRIVPVAISENIKTTAEKLYRIKKIRTILNGIDVESFRQKNDEKKTETINLINVGRFQAVKNHKLLINSFSDICKQFDNVLLYLIGNGELHAEIEKQITDLKLNSKVKLLGVQKDVAKFLHQSHIFVLPSNYEGLPLSLLEAMAAGLPIIATKVGGIPNVVGDNAILVPPQSKKELSNALRRVITDNKLRQEMGVKSIEKAQKFDIRNSSEQYCNLYIEKLKK
jgi:glycosyltransferase involved in cell wall biosynthesis